MIWLFLVLFPESKYNFERRKHKQTKLVNISEYIVLRTFPHKIVLTPHPPRGCVTSCIHNGKVTFNTSHYPFYAQYIILLSQRNPLTSYFSISNKLPISSFSYYISNKFWIVFKYILSLEISNLTSSKILSQSTHRNIKFSILVHIENFPSFVISKAKCQSVSVNFSNTEWHIRVQLFKYCQAGKEFILVTPSSSDQPETLSVCLCGRRSDRKECSFNVDALFKFKQPVTAQQKRYLHKFGFDSTTHYFNWGYRKFAQINVIFALFYFLRINFRIFWTSAMAIWLINHLNCSLMSPFLSAKCKWILLIIYRRVFCLTHANQFNINKFAWIQ